eukprot:4416563-Pyramimonas_sp.AAC.1
MSEILVSGAAMSWASWAIFLRRYSLRRLQEGGDGVGAAAPELVGEVVGEVCSSLVLHCADLCAGALELSGAPLHLRLCDAVLTMKLLEK